MSYDFTFDLSKLSQTLFKEISEFSEMGRITYEKIGEIAITLVKKFNVDKITGLPACDSIIVIEDLINANSILIALNRSSPVPCSPRFSNGQGKTAM